MQVLLIGVLTILSVTLFNEVNALIENPVRHPDCPLNDDPQNPTHLKYPSDCSKFYKCLNGFAYPMACPPGLHWNDNAKLCDWPNNANCFPESEFFSNLIEENDLIEELSNDSPIKDARCPAIDNPDKPKHLPYPNDCSKFYKCSHGYAYPMNCPPGEHFGVERDRCDWPHIAMCDPNAEKPSTFPTTSSYETTTPNNASSTPRPQPTNPSSASSTPSTVPTEPTTPEPLPPGITCDNVPHGTLYPHPDDCKKFIQCDYGRGTVKICPGILHFNPVLLVCDWPENANCTVPKISLMLAKQFSDPPIKDARCPETDNPNKPKHLSYPNDCSKFYKCSHGYAYPMNCPLGEHFGVEIDRCDWPYVAMCDPNAEKPTPGPEPSTTPTRPQPNTTTSRPEPSTTTLRPEPSTTPTRPETNTTPSRPELSTTPTRPETNTTTSRPDPTTVSPTRPESTTVSSEPTTTENPVTGTTSQTLPPGISCDNVPHGTLYPYPGDCKKFIHCSYGQGFVKVCPGILEFNPVLLVCDWPEVANCKAN